MCKACEFYEALHAGLKSHRSQRCGVKLIDTHCKSVAVMVSYDSILHVCELWARSLQRVFGEHNSSPHEVSETSTTASFCGRLQRFLNEVTH